MLIIDRFEGDKAVVEYNDTIFKIPKEVLPNTVKEGYVIKIMLDKEATKKRTEEIKDLSNELFVD